MSIYDISVEKVGGEKASLAEYKDKVLLIVNTATGCGFTPQYEGLEKLYEDYKDQGFEILDFPCNQFGNQAPGSNEEIQSFCQLKYKTSFETFAKIEVNGKNESELYRYLKKQKSGIAGSAIKWNFTKFLVSKEGKVVARFAPSTKPEDLASQIKELL